MKRETEQVGPAWQRVTQDDYESLSRIQVVGGWLYRLTELRGKHPRTSSLVYVPEKKVTVKRAKVQKV
jgi:hypothetical protein